MKPIAIQHRPGSFSDRWIQYCRDHQLDYRLVDCYAPHIISQLRESSALLWHINHGSSTDMLMARHVLNAAELLNIGVFPDRATQWHFDDKIAQKYMLEAIDAPLSPSFAFYDLKSAYAWLEQTAFPKVFKLRRGSGSRNVRLVRTCAEGKGLARKSFTTGYRPSGTLFGNVSSWKFQKAQSEGRLRQFLSGLPRKLEQRLKLDFMMGRERGYVYFQDFIPNNKSDTRVTIIGSRGFVFHRRARAGDFRASGSGQIVYGQEPTDRECLEIAFDVASRLGTQSLAFDFAHDAAGRPKILEVSFGFASKPIYDCAGFWDAGMKWHDSPTWPEDAILEDLMKAVKAA